MGLGAGADSVKAVVNHIQNIEYRGCILPSVPPLRPKPCMSLKKVSVSVSDKEPGDILKVYKGETVSWLVEDFGGIFPSVKVTWGPNPNQMISFPVSLSGGISNPLSPPPSLPCLHFSPFHTPVR